jgi:6,7-dimethyl-8-ribityllumazine synthase
MSSKDKNLSLYDEKNMPNASQFNFAVVVADWNSEITHALYQGCLDTLTLHQANENNIITVQVAGTFELPAAAAMVYKANPNLDAVICLGCVIKGETSHNEYINQSVAQALQQLSIVHARAFVFGVLTPNNQQQAQERAGGIYGNKGTEAAQTAIRMADLRHNLLLGNKKKIGF